MSFVKDFKVTHSIDVWKIGKYYQNICEKSIIGSGQNEIGHWLSIRQKIAQKLEKLSIFR